MSIIEPILKFIGSGLKAFNPEDKQQPVVVNLHQESRYGSYTMPYIMPVIQPMLSNDYFLPHYSTGLETIPVQFDVTFEPIDEGTFEYLDEDQPVVVFIYDPYEPEEFIYVVTDLNGIGNGELYPGTYQLLAIVYLDEDFDEIDGVGFANFTINEGELPFDLHVVVSSNDDDISDLLGEGYAPN